VSASNERLEKGEQLMQPEQLASRGAVGRVVAIGVTAMMSIAGFGIASATAASAAPVSTDGSGGSGGSAAIITPLLKILDFGDTFAVPEGCNTTASAVSAGAAEYNASAAVTPIVSATTSGCNQIVQAGHGSIQQGIAASQNLTFINPYVNPPLTALASGLQTVGNDYGPSLAPLGPTIVSLAPDVLFFEGS
jgi:hypothetical protein